MSESELFALLRIALPGGVFNKLAPQNQREPYVVYAFVTGTPQNTLRGGTRLRQCMYRVDAYARTSAEANAIMDRIAVLVDLCDGDPLIENTQDLYEQDTRIHRSSAVLSTWYEPDEVQS